MVCGFGAAIRTRATSARVIGRPSRLRQQHRQRAAHVGRRLSAGGEGRCACALRCVSILHVSPCEIISPGAAFDRDAVLGVEAKRRRTGEAASDEGAEMGPRLERAIVEEQGRLEFEWSMHERREGQAWSLEVRAMERAQVLAEKQRVADEAALGLETCIAKECARLEQAFRE